MGLGFEVHRVWNIRFRADNVYGKSRGRVLLQEVWRNNINITIITLMTTVAIITIITTITIVTIITIITFTTIMVTTLAAPGFKGFGYDQWLLDSTGYCSRQKQVHLGSCTHPVKTYDRGTIKG